MCLQDVEASPAVTMDRIRDLANYKNMVPKVKSVEVYHEETFPNGTDEDRIIISFNINAGPKGATIWHP